MKKFLADITREPDKKYVSPSDPRRQTATQKHIQIGRMIMSYRTHGFKSDPFSNRALPGNEAGEMLMVDRDNEVRKLIRRIQETDNIPTLEGSNGVGKTSIVNIALHRIFLQSMAHTEEPMFIPCRCAFQITVDKSVEDFLDEVYLQIALTLIDKEAILRPPPGYVKAPIEKGIKDYINSPIIRSYTATILGHGGGMNATPNSGKGWEKVGFRAAIEGWLRLLFPSSQSGAVICVIDNLELLHSSKAARDIIEALRDTAFSILGVKWLLCGSSGVVRGIATSPRLAGWLQKPLNIKELQDGVGGEVYDKRIETFKSKDDAALPLTRNDFITLFDMFNGNIRFALDEASAFCAWAFDELNDVGTLPENAFERWLTDELEGNYDEIFVYFSGNDSEVFNRICQLEIFVAADHNEAGVEDMSAFLATLEKFRKFGLIVSSLDQDDPGSAVYEVSPKALKLEYFLASQA